MKTNKKILVVDGITLVMILMFPFLPSYDHELFMTLLFLIGVLTFFNNLSLIRFNYKNEGSVESTFKIFNFVWAKMFIFSMLLAVCVEAAYLNNAISNPNQLNIYSHKAIIGWELMVHFYKWILFYVPIIAVVNAALFAITASLLLMSRNNTFLLLVSKFTDYKKETILVLKTLIAKFNLAILNIFKVNKQEETLVYLTNAKELLINNKKAQLPPLFFF